MKEKFIDTSLLDRAIIFAVKAHANTERRGKGMPYIVHPMEAVAIASSITDDQEILAAAALHDVVEDTGISADEIEREFGKRVADLVLDESDITIEGKSETASWHERKQFAIDHLKKASHDAKIVAISDKLSNMRTIARDYRHIGDKLWSRFHTSDPKEHEWHYRGLADSLRELEDTDAFREFEEKINQVFGK